MFSYGDSLSSYNNILNALEPFLRTRPLLIYLYIYIFGETRGADKRDIPVYTGFE